MTFSQDLRNKLSQEGGLCPTCKRMNDGGVRALAKRIGVGHSTLWRFLQGKQAQSNTLDKIVHYLDHHSKAKGRP